MLDGTCAQVQCSEEIHIKDYFRPKNMLETKLKFIQNIMTEILPSFPPKEERIHQQGS
jgi:hypothetical protein